MSDYPDARRHPENIDPSVFIAEGAQIVGDVRIGANSSVWYNSVLRADWNYIAIGENSNIQDGCVIHVDDDSPTIIGDGCSLGHGAIVHGAVIGDNVLIGMRATLLNGAKVGSGSIVAAGALVTENTEIPPNSLAVGVPARVLRQTNEENRTYIAHLVEQYAKLSKVHKEAQTG